MRVVESSNSRSRLVWNSRAVSAIFVEFHVLSSNLNLLKFFLKVVESFSLVWPEVMIVDECWRKLMRAKSNPCLARAWDLCTEIAWDLINVFFFVRCLRGRYTLCTRWRYNSYPNRITMTLVCELWLPCWDMLVKRREQILKCLTKR